MKDIFDLIGDTKQASEIWGLSQDTIKHMCQKGKIKSKKFGNSWIIDLTQKNPSYNKGDNKMSVKGIKKAVGEFNNYNGPIAIYLDKNKTTVYTSDANNFVDNANKDVKLVSKYYAVNHDNTTTMAKVKDAIERVLSKGE